MICESGTLHYLKNSFILKGISQGRKCLLDMIPIYYFLSTPSVPCPLVIHQSPWKGILWWQIYHWSQTVLSWLFSLVWHLCIGFNYCLDHSLWLVFNYLQFKKRYTIWVYAWGSSDWLHLPVDGKPEVSLHLAVPMTNSFDKKMSQVPSRPTFHPCFNHENGMRVEFFCGGAVTEDSSR